MLLLDSCAHPTCDGQWLGDRGGVTHAELADDLAASGWSGALAIGLPGVGGYDHRAFLELCRQARGLVPVAALTQIADAGDWQRDLDDIRATGYRIVKIHPRLLGYEQVLGDLPSIIGACVERDLAVALCTYPEYRSPIDPDEARAQMAAAIAAHPGGRFITMHTGVLDPAPFAAVAVENRDVLLDFSLSLTKYPDEVRARVIALADTVPHAISLGSDGPEWTYTQVRAALDDIAPELSDEAAAGLAGGNLRRWLAAIDPGLVPAGA